MTLLATPAQSVEDIARDQSATKTEDLSRCQVKYRYRYVLGLRRPQSYAMAFGSAWDRMSASYYAEAKQAKRPSNIATKEIFRYALGEEFKEAEAVSATDENRSEMLDEGVPLAGVWENQIARHSVPVAVQEAFRVDLGESVPFQITGILDFAGQVPDLQQTSKLVGTVPMRNAIVDDKTSRRKWSVKRVQDSLQAPTYFLAREYLGIETDTFQFHVAIRKAVPEMQYLFRRIDDSDIRGAILKHKLANAQVRSLWVSGAWMPNRNDMMCSRKYCPYWRECESEYGGTVSGAQEV